MFVCIDSNVSLSYLFTCVDSHTCLPLLIVIPVLIVTPVCVSIVTPVYLYIKIKITLLYLFHLFTCVDSAWEPYMIVMAVCVDSHTVALF